MLTKGAVSADMGDSIPYCLKGSFQTPPSSLSPNLSITALKQTARKCKDRFVRSISLRSSKAESTVLQTSPFRDQLSRDFQNKLECYFPWVKSVETDGYVVIGNPSGAEILLPVLKFWEQQMI